ncbi:MAG: T9SS type A sorting domain-containing protein [bacterium]|nr:T9SS type A sorting domain-containing protein [bacterium]
MKKLIRYLCIYSVLSFIFCNLIYSQDECGTQDFANGQAPYVNDYIGAYLKPHRTDLDNGSPSQSNATFNMLFVFVQFTNETTESFDWPIGQPPTFKNKFLDSVKNNTGNFWDRYRDSSLSDYYQEVSKGAFHVTGETRHLKTYHTWNYYKDTVGYNGLLTEIYTRLKADTTIQWTKFDQWSRNDATNNYVNVPDKYLDMMGIFFRHVLGVDFIGSGIELGAAGFVPLHGPNNYVMFANSTDTVKLGANRDKLGSGFIAKGNLGPMGYNRAMGIMMHEYGHYLFGGNHSTSGIMTSNGGISINDLFMSGYERYKLGLVDTATVKYNLQTSYTIRDVSGRSNTSQSPDFPQILRVPITSTDFFIIENRRKIADWDVYMLGDTSKNDPFRNTVDYGKGIYIYHSNNTGLNYAKNVDVECADGLWNWSYAGQTSPDWDDEQLINIYKRSSIPAIVNNDGGGFNVHSNSDGVSACTFFSLGKKHSSVGQTGTDKIFANETEYWTSREIWGDRWDAWNIGYNQMFSPYSNPNTKSYSNSNSGIYIYYNSLSNDLANFNIYRVGENGYTDSSILAITPPSRPMGIVVDYYVQTENISRPIITWNHNKEPDMLRTDLKKRYKIWGATHTTMNSVPTAYTLLTTCDIDSGTAPSYIDTSVIAQGSGWPGMGPMVEYPVRYKVQAIDKYQDSSVRSDFGSIIGIYNCSICEDGPDNIILDPSLPTEYSLYQNYPNPFNPETNIKFDLPEDNFVTIKVYDILGKEIFTLLNDFRNAGRYSINFNGSNFPSGIYYYKIKAGEFESIRKMILIK